MSASIELHEHSEEEDLPAWSLPAEAVDRIRVPATLPEQVTREWAWGGSTGAGVRVCILDSGIELEHPLVGRVDRSVAVLRDDDDELQVVDDTEGDLCGHGTACAGVVRSLAPDAELTSVRVLGAGYKGGGETMLRGLAWAIEQEFQVVNMSLSTTRTKYVERLHELADHAYFKRVLLVASAHNMPVESFPWRFASVISVGSHEETDPLTFYYNPTPPVEFFGRGLDLDLAWLDGGTLRATGNSFATPHIAGICALILGKHPDLTPSSSRASSTRRPRTRRRQRMSDLEAAVAAGVLGADEAHRALLQATVEVARAIFGAKAASVFLLDEEADELVFEAVAGEGEGELIGMRFPAGNGIAGWVLTTGEPLVVDDLSADTRWSRSAAESTGYVPKSMMAVPLLVDERALGVLSVLDRPTESKLRLAEVDLLGLFANQAAIALDLLQRARRARAALAGEGRLAPLARVAARLEEDERDAAFELLRALERVLAKTS